MHGLKAQKRLAQGVASLALGYVLLGFQGVHIVAKYNGKLAQKERPTIVKILRTSCNN